MKWPVFLFLLYHFLPNTTSAQNVDSIKTAALLSQATACLKKGEADSADAFHRQALKIFETNKNWIWWMKSHVRLAYIWAGDLQQPFVGIDLVGRAIDQAPWAPTTPSEWEQLSLTYLAKAYIYEDFLGDFVSAKREYEHAFQIFIDQLGEQSDGIASYVYHRYGNVCTRLGDYERAEILLRGGINYGKRHNRLDIPKFGDMAIILLDLKKNKEAIELIQDGVVHLGALAEPQIMLRRSEAEAYLNLGDIQAARRAAAHIPGLIIRLKNEEIARDEGYYWPSYFEILAAIDNASGNYSGAVQNYKRAIQYEIETWGTSLRREVGKLYWVLGDLYLRQNKHEAALKEFQEVLKCVLPGFQPQNSLVNPPDSLFYAENTILEALEGKAKAFRALGQLEKALECYELIPVVAAKLRATHAYESSKLFSLSESRQRFDEAVSIAWLLYERSNGDRRYADRAFRLTEQARGLLLLQSLGQAQINYQLPADVRQRENDLNVKLAWYEHEIAAERDAEALLKAKGEHSTRLARLEKQYLDLQQENEKFKSELRQRYPDYAALLDEIRFVESNAVATLLRPDQLLLDYYLTDQNVFVFSFDSKGAFSWRKAALPPNFRESVAPFVVYLQKGDEEDKPAQQRFRNMAHDLYTLLLAPELQRLMPQKGSLVIVPDDALVFVPFEVLLRLPAADENWRDLPWLLADYNTAYAYSATLLQMQQTISRQHRERHEAARFVFGGFAPSYSDPGKYQLTSTKALVKSAQQLLGGQTWSGAEANEARFKRMAPECRVLLLAMHGQADEHNPELSKLLFGDQGKDTLGNENILYSTELQIMQLQADLAVLSACESGYGKLQKGEGVYSLARAFTQAGVPATVMSLWLLHENTAAPLVQGFLHYLQAGKTKDEALRLAKLDFLKKDLNFDMGHPFFWAGVTTSGDMCALELPKSAGWPVWWWATGALALALGGWWMLRRRRYSSTEVL